MQTAPSNPTRALPDCAPIGRRGIRLLHRALPEGEGLVELLVLGSLPSRWPLALTGHLAGRGASLLRGHVTRGDAAGWEGRLVLDPRHGSLGDLDAALDRVVPRPATAAPRLIEVRIDPAHADAELHLEVHGWDAVGLLAGVLEQVACVDLCVEEMLLETEDECAFHYLRLRAEDGVSRRRAQRLLARGLGAHLTGGRVIG